MSPAVHQLYYTHCSSSTSALTRHTGDFGNRAFEYTVRAASLPPEELRECLHDVEPLLRYELPQDVPPDDRRTLTAGNAPPRLIFGRTGAGRNIVALISYRPYDLAGRPGSLFAHVLLQNSSSVDFSPLTCLGLWGAPGWVVEDSDSIPYDLPLLSSVAELHKGRQPVIDDRALLGFFLGSPSACPEVVPTRWRERPAAERRLLLLQAVSHLAAVPQRPVHFFAEPAFAALLFYGSLRMADASWTASDLTWSTFEPWQPRRLPTLSAQFTFDPHRLAQTAARVRRIAGIVDTFNVSSNDPSAPILAAAAPFFSREHLESGVRDRTSVPEWIETLRTAVRLAVPAVTPPGVVPSPPLPPPIIPGSAVRGRLETSRPSSKAEPAGRHSTAPIVETAPWADLVQAIEQGDEQEAWRLFDVRMIRTHGDALRPWHDSIQRIVSARVASGQDTLPTLPRVTDPIAFGRSGELVFRWNWPTVRLIDHCVLALTESPPVGTTAPEEGKLLARHVVARKHYELSSGYRVPLTTVPATGCWSVWGIVDLGFATLTGGGLILGEASTSKKSVTIPAAAPRSPYSLWRAGLGRLLSPFMSSRPAEARICPRCGGVKTRAREVRRDWVCDDCDHRWSGQPSVGAAFISYRRDGASEIARALRSELLRRGISTFLDVDDLRSHFYDDRLLREIESAPNFLLVLSPDCLDRCVDPDDWLRKEIVHAMRHDRNIVPVLTQGFVFPRPGELTPELCDLPRYNCVEYSHAYFSATIQKLVDFMKKI